METIVTCIGGPPTKLDQLPEGPFYFQWRGEAPNGDPEDFVEFIVEELPYPDERTFLTKAFWFRCPDKRGVAFYQERGILTNSEGLIQAQRQLLLDDLPRFIEQFYDAHKNKSYEVQ